MSRDGSGRSRTQAASEAIAVDIEAVDPSGDGLARYRGTRIFVPFSIPGERVRVRVKQTRGRDAWASIEAIVNPSPHRVAPRCAHFGAPDVCGGCTWQHIAYPEQLRLKSDLVRRLVSAAIPRHAPHVENTLPGTAVDDPWGYRQKVHFVFANASSRGPIVMGHYKRGSRAVFSARECPVHDPRGNAFAFRVRDACVRAGVAGPPQGTIRHLAVRVAPMSGEMMATMVVSHMSDKRLRGATKRVLEAPDAPQSFHVNLHDAADPYIFGDETRRVRGPRHLRERVAGATFLVSPTAFFQTNSYAAEVLVRLVLDALPAGKPVLDLYAGVGLFAIPLARRGDTVVAVEENRAATNDGVASVKLNGLTADRCRFIPSRVESALRTMAPASATHVVLDPPRDGCVGTVLDEVFGRLRPDRAVYVSCNPEALATDLARIVGRGYLLETLQPVDMFPHTAHVETVAVLRLASRP
jgi:23S rRNA (uracil1939-C5)-methyltransferase